MTIMAPVVNADVVRKMFLPVINTLSQDKIANLRMNSAKTIKELIPTIKGNADLEEKFRQLLNQLSNDIDDDVKYYASRAKNSV